jgi:PHS family inorganic phosphate transporter-like MFS transporter
VGRRRLQFYSSLIAAVLYAIWAGVSKTASSGGLMVLFTLSQFVLGGGPNITTFLMPVELFPTRVRGSAHGISAASGKCGAVLTAYAFGTVVDSIGLRGVLGLFSGIMALVALVTLLIPETKGKTLEEIESGVLYGDVVERQPSSAESSVMVTDENAKVVEARVQSVSV